MEEESMHHALQERNLYEILVGKLKGRKTFAVLTHIR
jgi:hypothetical protein